MKSVYLVAAIFLLLFVGCSSTYWVGDFTSKEEFYEDFNSNFKDREAKIILANDSTLVAVDGVIIKNDTLIANIKFVEKNNREVLLSDAVEINYEGKDNRTAKISLKNGEEFHAENINISHDTVKFVEVMNLIKSSSNQIDKVKTVSYNNQWKGIFSGGKMGLFSGVLLGYLMGKASIQQLQPDKNPVKSDEHEEGQEIFYPLFGAVFGFISGGIVGYFVGYPTTYVFDK